MGSKWVPGDFQIVSNLFLARVVCSHSVQVIHRYISHINVSFGKPYVSYVSYGIGCNYEMQLHLFWGSSSSGMQFWGNSNIASDNILIITKCKYTCSGVAPVRAGSSGVTPILRQIIYDYLAI